MKRLIALLISLFTALGNNVAYVQPDHDLEQFTHNSYYIVEEGDAPNFRDIYSNSHSISIANTCSQSTQRVSANAKRITITGQPNLISSGRGYYIIDDGSDHTIADLPTSTTYTVTEDVDAICDYIVCPFPAELISKPACSPTGVLSVELTVGIKGTNEEKYTMNISNLVRWNCCLNKPSPDAIEDVNGTDIPIYVHTYSEWPTTEAVAGCILGEVKAGTTIEIYDPSGNRVSLQELYTRAAELCSE